MVLRLIFFVSVILLSAFSSVATAYADTWSVAEFRDPVKAELVSAATMTNAQGYSIYIFRNSDSKVRWVLSLPRSSLDRIKAVGRVAALRIDDNESIDYNIAVQKDLLDLEQPTVLEGKSIRDILWHGQGPSPTRGTLRNMLDGKVLEIRFFFDAGNFIDTTFELAGAGAAIGPALKINTVADPALIAQARDREEALLISTTICQSSPDVPRCLGVMTKCMGPKPNELTGSQMRSCMAENGYPFDRPNTPASGETVEGTKTLTANCTALGSLARSIMEKRQGGTDMSELMSVVDKFDVESFKPIARSMVMMAYSMPRFNGEEFKQKTILDFSNQVQLACYQGNK